MSVDKTNQETGSDGIAPPYSRNFPDGTDVFDLGLALQPGIDPGDRDEYDHPVFENTVAEDYPTAVMGPRAIMESTYENVLKEDNNLSVLELKNHIRTGDLDRVAGGWAALVARDRVTTARQMSKVYRKANEAFGVDGMGSLKDQVSSTLRRKNLVDAHLQPRRFRVGKTVITKESWMEQALKHVHDGDGSIPELAILLDLVHPEPRYSLSPHPRPVYHRVIDVNEAGLIGQAAHALWVYAGNHYGLIHEHGRGPQYRIVGEYLLYMRMHAIEGLPEPVDEASKYRLATSCAPPKNSSGGGAHLSTKPVSSMGIPRVIDRFILSTGYGDIRGPKYLRGNY